MVIMAHLTGTRGFVESDWSFAELGVRVFFVISGYLITTLLLTEIDRYGGISIPRFYLRRTFRIFPVYYLYLSVVGVFAWLGYTQLTPGDAAHAFTYTTNYHPHRAWLMGHTWSLAVEEQFYLTWPALLVLVGRRRGLWAAAAFVALGPVLRLADWYLMPGWHAMQGESFWTIGDSIAGGCVLAGIRPRLDASARWHALQRSPLFVLVPFGVLACAIGDQFWTLPSLAMLQTIQIVGIAACIDWAIRYPDSPVGRVLNWRPIALVGVLSYSLYLWQQPFLDRHADRLTASFPLNVGLAFAVAIASYLIVERPLMRARGRIEARLLGKRTARHVVPAAATAGR